MRTWFDLEERFSSLVPALRHARLDLQWGAAGEYWWLVGTGATGAVERQFKTLCAIGGRLLEQSIDPKSELGAELLAELDPEIRWYRLLKRGGHGIKEEPPGFQSDEEGNHLGMIYSASIAEIAAVCANQCLELHARHPVREPAKPWYERLYDDYGKELIRGAFAVLIAAMLTAAIAWVFG